MMRMRDFMLAMCSDVGGSNDRSRCFQEFSMPFALVSSCSVSCDRPTEARHSKIPLLHIQTQNITRAGFAIGGLGAVGKAPQPQAVPMSQQGSQQPGGPNANASGLGISFGSNSGMESLWGPLSLSKQSSTSSFWNPHLAEADPMERVPDALQVLSWASLLPPNRVVQWCHGSIPDPFSLLPRGALVDHFGCVHKLGRVFKSLSALWLQLWRSSPAPYFHLTTTQTIF